MILRGKWRWLGVGLVGVTMLVSACGGATQNTGNAEAGNTSVGAKSGPVTITYIENQLITTPDPAKDVDESSMHAVVNTYDPLLRPKLAEKSMEPGPWVADSWQVSSDGKTYTFKIHPGIKFHSGNTLTAEDVRWSMERMLALKQGFSWLWNGIIAPGSTEAKGDTVIFHLKQPYAPFLATLTQLFIVDEKDAMAHKQAGDYGSNGDYAQAWLAKHDAGSGPYTLNDYDPNTGMVLKKYPGYWKGWQPNQIDVVNYKVVKEEATTKQLLKSGQADIVNQWLTPEAFAELAKTPGVTVQVDPSVQLFHLPINTQKAPTNNIHIRKMLAYAFDYATADKDIFAGAPQAIGPVPNKTWGHVDDVLVFHQDLNKAKEELQASGINPKDLHITMEYNSGASTTYKVALLLQSDLAKIGVDLKLVPATWAQITQHATKPDTTPNISAIFDTLKYPHPDSHTYGMYAKAAQGSYRTMSWLDDPKVEVALQAARKATTTEDQLKLYGEAQRLIAAEVPSIYVANPLHRIAFRSNIKGYTYVGLLGYDLDFWTLSVSK